MKSLKLFSAVLCVFCISGCDKPLPREKPAIPNSSIKRGSLNQEGRAEYDRLRMFYVTYYRSVDSTVLEFPGMGNPEDHLQLPEADDASNAELEGLKQGVNDTLFMHTNFSSVTLDEADRILAQEGAPLLSDLLREYQSDVDEIVRRGYIQDDTEFYLLRELADDNPQLFPLLEEYEFGDR